MRNVFRILIGVGMVSGIVMPGLVHAAESNHAWAVDANTLTAEAKSLAADSPWKKSPLFCYVVPAISAVRRMPDTLPPDGVIDHNIQMTGAMGEFIPTSFIVAPLKDIAKLELKTSALRPVGKEGEKKRAAIQAENIDVKVVKCWWQHGTAWSASFQDKARRELVPELLLNDENLIKVDLENQEHYLRVDYPEGPQYVWISYEYPYGSEKKSNPSHTTLPVGATFDFHNEPIADSPVLLPVKLHTGRLQQFWVTVKVPEKADAGLYEGDITLTADGIVVGKMALALRVLPFTLPDPLTYYDLDRDFFVAMDGMPSFEKEIEAFKGDRVKAEKRTRNLLKNMREHSVFNHQIQGAGWLSYKMRNTDMVRADLEFQKDAGLKPPVFGLMSSAVTGTYPKDKYPEIYEAFKTNVTAALDLVESVTGSREAYLWGWGEPGQSMLKNQRDGWRAANEMGAMIGSEGKASHFKVAGFAEDLLQLAAPPFNRELTTQWHAVGQRVTVYCNPHPGAENPDLARRNHGMQLYKNWYDGTKNNEWGQKDDWLTFNVSSSYRIRLVYTTQDEVIDTIHWEGFREGIDDVRYATKLKLLAAEAIATGKTDKVYPAKKALLWLELTDTEGGDLNAMRMEMINYIMQLINLLDA